MKKYRVFARLRREIDVIVEAEDQDSARMQGWNKVHEAEEHYIIDVEELKKHDCVFVG